jgi:hypothetical protein
MLTLAMPRPAASAVSFAVAIASRRTSSQRPVSDTP